MELSICLLVFLPWKSQRQGTSDFLLASCHPEQAVEQTVELSVIWNAVMVIWRHCDGFLKLIIVYLQLSASAIGIPELLLCHRHTMYPSFIHAIIVTNGSSERHFFGHLQQHHFVQIHLLILSIYEKTWKKAYVIYHALHTDGISCARKMST